MAVAIGTKKFIEKWAL